MSDDVSWVFLAMGAGCAALVVAWWFARGVLAADVGNERMQELMGAIREGAMAYLRRQYVAIAAFVGLMAVLIVALLDWGRPWGAVAYLAGAALSALAGFAGMRIATAANARTAEAARQGGVARALPLAFRGGAVTGLSVAGLGILGFASAYWVFVEVLALGEAFEVLTALALGGSTIALFARVGGGIYTKAADVGADLVGKVEEGIPDDDPRNPATIADNVGDNVGDVAGMGADLFESYLGALVAPVVFAALAFDGMAFQAQAFMFPLLVAAVGTVGSIAGCFLVRPARGNLAAPLHRGPYVAVAVTVAGTAALAPLLFGDVDGVANPWGLVLSVVSGLAVGWSVGRIAEVFTSDRYKVVREVARQAQTGPATVLLSGTAEGMRSAAYSALAVAAGTVGAYYGGALAFGTGAVPVADGIAGVYGITVAAIGVLATLGITVSVDAYGPIADNAGGIAAMAGLDPEVRQVTDTLDALGNTTAAVAKGFAIASAAVTALALFFTFRQAVGPEVLGPIDVLDVRVTAGLFVGAMFPFLFASQTIRAVGRAAAQMVDEVRRQFREIPGLREGTPGARPEYARCVDIATAAALRETVIPGTLAVALPLVVGFVSVQALGGLLAGALVTGLLLAIYMSNAGGAWDNAKKLIEAGAFGGRGSVAHAAAVAGDTVGDPFKDTAAPAMNVVIKVMVIVSLLFASAF